MKKLLIVALSGVGLLAILSHWRARAHAAADERFWRDA
jgi:hypothetical protein